MVLCPLCNNASKLFMQTEDYNRITSRLLFNYYRCTKCGLIFLSPIPVDLGDYYPNGYYSIPNKISDLALAAEQERYKIDIVKKYANNGRLLEIGPSFGSFLYLAKQVGFESEAIEMDSACCNFLHDVVGVKAVQSADPESALRNMSPYDVITMWHVIEHLPDPWQLLKTAGEKLNPGGILVIAAPNPFALQFHIMGRFWPHVDAPRHVALIPESLLTDRITAMGFKKVLTTTDDPGARGWNIFGWQFFFTNLSQNRFLKFGLRIFGRLIAAFMSPFERREGKGSAYTLVFRKEL